MSDELSYLLEHLADESRPVRSLDLTHISDLTRDELGEFRAVWGGLAPARRLELMTVMVEQAEANIQLNFHAILRACLVDEDAQVRRLAVDGLWEDERISLVQPLIALLAADPAPEVRAAAATSLGRFVLLGVLGDIAEEPGRAAEEALHAAWYRASEPIAVRRRALEGLACTNAAGIHDLINSAYYHDDDLMRQSAVFAMGRSADPRWNRMILAELGSPEPPMRFEAAIAAGEMALRSAVPALIDRLDDPDSNVREAAVMALGKIGGPAARRTLQSVLEGDDERLAEATAEALDELRFNSEQMDDALLDFTDKPAGRRSRAAAESDLGDTFDETAEDDFSDDDDDEFDDDFDDDAADDLGWDDELGDDSDELEDDLDEDDLAWDDDEQD
jgi:HEAT repeat protein